MIDFFFKVENILELLGILFDLEDLEPDPILRNSRSRIQSVLYPFLNIEIWDLLMVHSLIIIDREDLINLLTNHLYLVSSSALVLFIRALVSSPHLQIQKLMDNK